MSNTVASNDDLFAFQSDQYPYDVEFKGMLHQQ
jgi:hypothetical protein